MRNKLNMLIGGILFIISLGMIAYVGIGISQGGSFRFASLITTGIAIGIPLLAGTAFWVAGISARTKKLQFVSYIEWMLFMLYDFLLLSALFGGGRGYMNYESTAQYIQANVNLVPFKTIMEYGSSFIHQTINMDTIVLNLFGNFVLFMPMAVLLPCIFEKVRTWKTFLFYMLIILGGVELIQLVTKTGALDIDDFILNMSGACFAFAVMRRDAMIRFCEKLYLIEIHE